MTSQFIITPQFLPQDHLQLDVMAHGLPEHFLGVGFDLVVPEGWAFDHARLCGIFSEDDGDVFHLVAPRTDEHRVFFGLTVPGGAKAALPDGCLASFSFRTKNGGPGEVFFDHGVLSVYQDGRRDIGDVKWQGSAADLSAVSSRQVVQTPPQVAVFTQQKAGPELPLDSKLSRADFLANIDASILDVYVVMLFTLAVFSALFGLFLAYFRLRRKD